ncbi:hypothetical protein NTGHW29_300068 [Candidatus Nitrotoga sp. HW29]|nr:hypothetical protein NTGHW29_300068 [Candidatus Nitrotoga sp. HW29]
MLFASNARRDACPGAGTALGRHEQTISGDLYSRATLDGEMAKQTEKDRSAAS